MLPPDRPHALTRTGPWLLARYAVPHRVLSWAIVGGGLARARTVAWLRVTDGDLPEGVDPRELLLARLQEADLPDAVGMLTAANLDRYEEATACHGGVSAHVVVTVGLSNARRVGDAPGSLAVGTINLLVTVSVPLTDEALVEAASLAVEARTVAVLEAGVRSPVSGGMASGTGTDCVVIAAVDGPDPHAYAGKHTDVGCVIGAAVLEATARGVAAWRARNPGDPRR
jgi:adenosylcobinamide amidohydrolase